MSTVTMTESQQQAVFAQRREGLAATTVDCLMAADWEWHPDVAPPCGKDGATRWLVWGWLNGEGPFHVADCDEPQAAEAIVQTQAQLRHLQSLAAESPGGS